MSFNANMDSISIPMDLANAHLSLDPENPDTITVTTTIPLAPLLDMLMNMGEAPETEEDGERISTESMESMCSAASLESFYSAASTAASFSSVFNPSMDLGNLSVDLDEKPRKFQGSRLVKRGRVEKKQPVIRVMDTTTRSVPKVQALREIKEAKAGVSSVKKAAPSKIGQASVFRSRLRVLQRKMSQSADDKAKALSAPMSPLMLE